MYRKCRNITSIILAKINFKEVKNHHEREASDHPQAETVPIKGTRPGSVTSPGTPLPLAAQAGAQRVTGCPPTCARQAVEGMLISCYAISPQVWLDGNNIHRHRAQFTGW